MSQDPRTATRGAGTHTGVPSPRRRTVLLAGVLAELLALTSCTGDEGSRELDGAPTASADGVPVTGSWRWSVVPEPPSIPRWRAVTAWTGTEALFLGGSTEPVCPSDSRKYCSELSDPSAAERGGMAFDPGANRWRRTAPAPQGLQESPRVVVGQRVHVLTEDALLVYDAAQDDWTQLPLPPGHPANSSPGYSLTAFDEKLVALAPGYDAAAGETPPPRLPDSTYDLTQTDGGRWIPLPENPLDSVVFRQALPTPYGLLLVAGDVARSGPTDAPPLACAALLDPASSTWRRLPDSDQLFAGNWTWTGERALDATPGGDAGLNGSYGRDVPCSGALALPAGTWASVPQPPESTTRGWLADATAGPRSAIGGYVYDDTARTWTLLPAPEEGRTAEQPGPAVWTNRGLLVLGSRAIPTVGQEPLAPSRSAWLYHPPR